MADRKGSGGRGQAAPKMRRQGLLFPGKRTVRRVASGQRPQSTDTREVTAREGERPPETGLATARSTEDAPSPAHVQRIADGTGARGVGLERRAWNRLCDTKGKIRRDILAELSARDQDAVLLAEEYLKRVRERAIPILRGVPPDATPAQLFELAVQLAEVALRAVTSPYRYERLPSTRRLDEAAARLYARQVREHYPDVSPTHVRRRLADAGVPHGERWLRDTINAPASKGSRTS